MVFACSVILPSPRSTSTPSCPSSLVIVEVSINRGMLASESGFAVSSAAHMIGSAAFFAPEMVISPCNGRPPTMRSLSTAPPFFGGQRLHGQRMDFFAHPVAEGGIDHLVPLDTAAALEGGRHDHGLEVLAVAGDLDVLAGKACLDSLLDAVGGDHVSDGACSLRRASEARPRKSTASLLRGPPS